LTKNYFKVGGIYYDRKGSFEIQEIDINKDKIRAKYINSNEEFTRTDLNFIKSINDHVFEERSTIWWVCHQFNLWDIDQRLIGFHRKVQRDALKEENIVIYYRIGEDQIKGVFRIISKGEKINPAFNDNSIESAPIYQCRLNLVCDKIICNKPSSQRDLSFFDKWSAMRHGGLKVQVFPANRKDLEIVIGKEASDNIILRH